MYIEDIIFFDIIQTLSLIKSTCSILDFEVNKLTTITITLFKIFISLCFISIELYWLKICLIFFFLLISSLGVKLNSKKVNMSKIMLSFFLSYFAQNGIIVFLFNSSKLELFKLINPSLFTIISILICILYESVCFGISRYLYKKKIINNFIYDLNIRLFNKEISIKAFLDTGNALYDKEGFPVVLLNIFECNDLFDEETYTYLLLKQFSKLNKEIFFTINAQTVCGKSLLACFSPEKISVNGKDIDSKVCVALTSSNLNKGVNCGCLLHPKLFLS